MNNRPDRKRQMLYYVTYMWNLKRNPKLIEKEVRPETEGDGREYWKKLVGKKLQPCGYTMHSTKGET